MKLLITTSTFPVSAADPVPAFVRDQVIHLKELDPNLKVIVHTPHNYYSRTTKSMERSGFYEEVRFHYFWPYRLELLSGRGIMPALRANKLLYGQIPFLIVSQAVSLWRVVRKHNPDLLYAHWFTPQALTTAFVSRLTGVPFVFTTHASDVSVLRNLPFAKALVQLVCRYANAYSAVSERTAEKLASFFDEYDWKERYAAKLMILPMGVETDPPRVEEEVLDRTKKRYAIDQRPVVLYLGRLAEKKGVVHLIEAVAMLPDKLRDGIQLIIAGDGQLRERLEGRAQELNLSNVRFVGYVSGEQKAALLALAEIVCLPSVVDRFGDSEGFPVVLMEALAAGKVVLASNVSGGEVVLQDGETGFLFMQESSEELAATLMRALNLSSEEREALKVKSRELSTQFSWRAISRKYYRFFKDAVSDGV